MAYWSHCLDDSCNPKKILADKGGQSVRSVLGPRFSVLTKEHPKAKSPPNVIHFDMFWWWKPQKPPCPGLDVAALTSRVGPDIRTKTLKRCWTMLKLETNNISDLQKPASRTCQLKNPTSRTCQLDGEIRHSGLVSTVCSCLNTCHRSTLAGIMS